MREQSRKEGAPRNTAGRQRGRIAARDRSKQQEPTRHTHARRNQPHPCRQTTEASLSSLSYVEGTPEDVYKERDGNQLVSERVRVCARLVTCNPCKTEITKGQKLSKLKLTEMWNANTVKHITWNAELWTAEASQITSFSNQGCWTSCHTSAWFCLQGQNAANCTYGSFKLSLKHLYQKRSAK